MRRAWIAIALSAVVAGAGGVEGAAGQSGVKECGDVDRGVGIKNLTTRGVSCRRARRVARTHPRDITPLGFRCKDREIAQYTYDIRCTKGSKVVRWQYNSD